MKRRYVFDVMRTNFLEATSCIRIEKLRKFRALNPEFEDIREHSPLLKIVKDDRISSQDK